MERSSAALSIETVKLLDEFCTLLLDPECERRSGLTQADAEDQTARFRIWGGNLGAFQRLPANSSLDYRLRESPKVAAQISSNLEDLQETTKSLLAIASGALPNRCFDGDEDDDSETSDEESHATWKNSGIASTEEIELMGTSEAEELFGSIKDTIASLFRLAMIIRQFSPRDRFAKALSGPNLFDEAYDIAHVGHKFTKLEATPNQWLRNRLGRAITQRRQFLRYSREHRLKLDKGAERDEKHGGASAHLTFLEPSLGFIEKSQAGRTNTTRPSSTLAPTSASTLLLEEIPTQVDFSDSLSQTSFAVSLGEEESADRFQLPSLMEASKGAASFECPLCWTIQSFRKESAWRKHIYSDLRPYICTFDDCDLKLFSNRRDWFEHELQHHRTRWFCHFCKQDGFKTAESFRAHLLKNHIRGVTDSQVDALLEAGASPVTSIPASECPFCEDWTSTLRDANPDISGDTIVVTLNQFRHHVGSHLQNLALFAIPRGYLEDGEGENNSAASVQAAGLGSLHPSQQSGISFGSMSSDEFDFERWQMPRGFDAQAFARFIEGRVIYGSNSDIIATLTSILPALTSKELQSLEDHIYIPRIICTDSIPLERLIRSTCRGKRRGEAFWLTTWSSFPQHSQIWWSIAVFILVGRRSSAYSSINDSLMEDGLSISECIDKAFSGSDFPQWVRRSLEYLAAKKGRCKFPPFDNCHEVDKVTIFHEYVTSMDRSDEKRTELLAWCMGQGGPVLRKLDILYRAQHPQVTLGSRLLDFLTRKQVGQIQSEQDVPALAATRFFLENVIVEVMTPGIRDTSLLQQALIRVSSSVPQIQEWERLELVAFHISRLHWRNPEMLFAEARSKFTLGHDIEQEINGLSDHSYRDYCLALIQSRFDVPLLGASENDNNIGDRIRAKMCALPGVISCINLGLEKHHDGGLEIQPVLQFDSDAYTSDPALKEMNKSAIRKILQDFGILEDTKTTHYNSDPETGDEIPLSELPHWATRIFDGHHTFTPFQTLTQPTVCHGRDEPRVLELLENDGFDRVLELPFEATNVWVRLYWRADDYRARILFLTMDEDGTRRRYCFPLTGLIFIRSDTDPSCLQLCRVNRKDGQLDLWARLGFTLYERMVLFYCTSIAMKYQDQVAAAPGVEDDYDSGETLEFSGEVSKAPLLHSFRVWRDNDSGGVRLEVTPRRGPGKHVPIWTAFVTAYVGRKSWVKRVGTYTVQLRELHPYIFCSGYEIPQGPTGRYELRFTEPEDARMFIETFHNIGQSASTAEESHLPKQTSDE